MKRFACILAAMCLCVTLLIGCISAKKPVIYLYPTEKTDVDVVLDYDGTVTATYPTYDSGWHVTAYPDGTLVNKADGREYSYLFWEGEGNLKPDLSRGYVVPGGETKDFLQRTLSSLGLTPKEYNEFIVYWLPQMQKNPYNLISFQSGAYTEHARMKIAPKPDSVLRVFMAYKALKKPVDIPPQELTPFVRTGFAVVEWGGAEVK